MAVLPQVICATLGLPEDATVPQFFEYVRGATYDVLDGLITADLARDAAEASFAVREQYTLRIIDQLSATQLRFCSVAFSDHALPVLVGMLPERPETPLPTELENLLLWALVDPLLPLHARWAQGQAGPVSEWRTHVSGKAILALPANMPSEAVRLVSAMYGLVHPEIGHPRLVPSLLDSAAHVVVGSIPSSFSAVQARLLREAMSAKLPKWRCLSMYRILENAYLSTIKRILLTAFDDDATKAVKDAQAKLGSEVNQLVTLAEEANLIPEFLAFNIEYETLLAANNMFIIMLDKGAEGEALYKSQDLYKKAVIRLYKLRCSIAHAGTSSVIYEQFSDADAAAFALAPSMESIAIKSMKITV